MVKPSGGRIMAMGWMGFVLAWATTPAGAREITDAIPADAKVAVVIRDIANLETELAAFVENIKLPVPPDAIKIKNAAAMLGFPIELGQQAALVVMDPRLTACFLIVEVDDANAVRELPNLERVGEGDDPEMYSSEAMGMQIAIAIKDDLVIVQLAEGEDASFAEILKPTKSLTGTLDRHQQEMLEECDVFFTVNVAEWRELALAGLDVVSEAMRDGMAQAGGQDAINVMPGMSMEGYFQWLFDGAKTIVRETKHTFGGIEISGDEVHLHIAAQFAEGSYLESVFPAVAVPTEDLLAGLPDHEYLVAGGGEVKPFGKLMRDFTSGIYDSMFPDLDEEARKELNTSMAYFDRIDRMNMLFDLGGPKGMVGTGVFESDDPEAAYDEYKKTIRSSEKMMKALYGMDWKIEPIEKKVGERTVVEYSMDMSKMMPKVDDAGPAMPNVLEAVYGGPELKYQMAVLDESLGFAMAAEGNPITLLESEEKLTDNPATEATMGALPSRSAGVALIHPLRFIEFVSNMTAAIQPDAPKMPKPEPKGLVPPIGLAVETEKGLIKMDLMAKSETVKALVQYMQNQMGPPPF